jgi:hypothetical protein
MKHLNIEKEQEHILDNNNAFFAFSNEQFNSCADQSVAYSNLGGGLYCPTGNVDALINEFDEAHSRKIQWELSNNTLKDIIWDSLANYECQIIGDYSDALDALQSYGISEDDIKKEWNGYYQNCIDNDYTII